MPEQERSTLIHEDWVVVITGFSVILLALAGLNVPVPGYKWNDAGDLISSVLTLPNLFHIMLQFLFVLVLAVFSALLVGKPIRSFLFMFALVFALSVIALVIAGNKTVYDLNLEAVIFSLTIGLLVGNFLNVPQWLRDALSTEMFVKIGLVVLGTKVIFKDILTTGSYGLLQALIVVLSVWYFAFWICRKLRVDKEMSMMISSAVSICGVSAAIATAGAIKGDTKKLSYVISLVLITAIPMMIFMPYIAQWLGLSQTVTGAWIGGSIDTTGAVVASGTLVGDEALKISTIVKFSQNLLLGIAAFAISIYWTISKSKPEEAEHLKPGFKVIWERFPKFVLGFVAASLLFSFFIDRQTIDATKSSLSAIQNLWFVLAFTSIGLETKFSELLATNNRRPMYAFVIAQFFNILVTLLVAWMIFR